MFTEPRPNLIVSNEGFSVEVLGRAGLQYQSDDGTIRVNSEVLAGRPAIAVWPSSIKTWDSPAGTRPVTQEERNVIVSNIRRALQAVGAELEVI